MRRARERKEKDAAQGKAVAAIWKREGLLAPKFPGQLTVDQILKWYEWQMQTRGEHVQEA